MDELLDKFGFGLLHDCLTVKRMLDKKGKTWDDFIAWMNTQKLKPKIQRPRIPDLPRKVLKRACPECKNWVRLYEVNTLPTNQIDDHSRCQWYCEHCEWQEFSDKNIVKEALPYVEELTVIYIPVYDKPDKLPCSERKR